MQFCDRIDPRSMSAVELKYFVYHLHPAVLWVRISRLKFKALNMLFTPKYVSEAQCGCRKKRTWTVSVNHNSSKWHFTVLGREFDWQFAICKTIEIAIDSKCTIDHQRSQYYTFNHSAHAKPLCNEPNNQNTFDYKPFVSQYWNSMLKRHKN